MKTAICHYSYHRTWEAEGWDCGTLARKVKEIGADAVDFHTRFIGDTSASEILTVLKETGLALSGLSFSNNFNQQEEKDFRAQVDQVKSWIALASQLQAPVCRIFGGGLKDKTDLEARKAGLERVLNGLREVVDQAERHGVILALENHGGLPCTGEEQVDVIQKIDSPHLRATIDVGNYLQCGQEGHDGTAAAIATAAYIHLKDYHKKPDSSTPWGWSLEPCAVGEGDVDQKRCLRIAAESGYNGFVALEYEGLEDEATGVPKSLAFMKKVLQEL